MQNPLAAISLSEVTLQLASTAGPVNILNGVTLKVPAGQTIALTAVRFGKVVSSDGGVRPGAAHQRAG